MIATGTSVPKNYTTQTFLAKKGGTRSTTCTLYPANSTSWAGAISCICNHGYYKEGWICCICPKGYKCIKRQKILSQLGYYQHQTGKHFCHQCPSSRPMTNDQGSKCVQKCARNEMDFAALTYVCP